jgi:hypothetical protein
MGMGTINLEKSVSQVSKQTKRGNAYGQGDNFLDNDVFAWGTVFACRFWTTREEMSAKKSTNHDGIEGKLLLGCVLC